MRSRQILAVCAASAIFSVAIAGQAVASAPAAKDQEDQNSTGISMSLDSLAPVVPRPKDDLQLAGTITNTSDREIGGANVELRLSQERMGNRAQLAKVADGSETPNTRGVSNGSVEVKATLAPGASAPWSIKVPMSDLGLGNSGVHGLRVGSASRDD